MDLETNLMTEEERNSIQIHGTCRQTFNEVRKRFKEVEELSSSNDIKKHTVHAYKEEYITERDDPELGNGIDNFKD